ncbi:hypothetical protein [Bdellovibrio sp. HCB337]|uniref:hypothetical protein n=1 Tax=Bdellovibrio sp. HCB337 TaxID=3394358 RepID=UPI0039A71D75
MNFSLRSLSFIVIFCLSSSFVAHAKAPRCEAVFQPNVAQIIERVNQENGQYLFQGKSFEEFSESLSWLRKRKIRKLVQDIDVTSFTSEKALERHSIELGMALFGKKNVVDRWLFQSREARLEETTIIMIRDQLLNEGLLKTWGENSNLVQAGILKKASDRISNILHSRYGQLVLLPYFLPGIRDNKISPELMAKVIRDGVPAHIEEVRVALGRQDHIDAYNTFRKLYTPIFIGVTMISHLQAAYAELERQQELQAKEAIRQLREQRESILQNIDAAKQEIIQQAYETAEAEFIQKWGEPPTPEEKIQLKAKIEKALGLE